MRRPPPDGLATVADQMEKPGGTQAANLRVAENYLEQFGKLAKEGNTMILPTDLANISGPRQRLTSVIKQAKRKKEITNGAASAALFVLAPGSGGS